MVTYRPVEVARRNDAGDQPSVPASSLRRRDRTACSGDRQAEQPVDESNHALAALRYLVSRLDGRHFELDAGTDAKPESRGDDDEDDDRLWRRIA